MPSESTGERDNPYKALFSSNDEKRKDGINLSAPRCSHIDTAAHL